MYMYLQTREYAFIIMYVFVILYLYYIMRAALALLC